jgi:predicted porin
MLKKVLLIGAVCASTAGTAAANSNVTIYGIVDTGFKMVDNGVDKFSNPIDGGLATSRLGFRGSEDLGGGLKAEFMLEGQLNPSTGSIGSTTVAANEIFNRESWVGLSSTKFGSIRMGRSDVTNTQNVDFYAGQFGNFSTNSRNGINMELGTDVKNVVRYTTPDFKGLTVELGYASGTAASGDADAGGDHKGIFVRYKSGKLGLFGGTHSLGSTATASAREYSAVGGSYNFGVASVGASYGQGDVNNANGKRNTVTQASVSVPLSNGVKIYGVYSIAEDGAQASDGKGNSYTMGVTKALSKRTTLYAAYSMVNNQSNSKMFLSRQGAAPTTAGLDTTALSAGISHRF